MRHFAIVTFITCIALPAFAQVGDVFQGVTIQSPEHARTALDLSWTQADLTGNPAMDSLLTQMHQRAAARPMHAGRSFAIGAVERLAFQARTDPRTLIDYAGNPIMLHIRGRLDYQLSGSSIRPEDLLP